jgi:glycosyltransferase involved in cell wall biosynthesis
MIAYVITQYPKVSHSFVRREILALEAQGVKVVRFAFRGWDAVLADAVDIAERDITNYLLRDGSIPLLRAMLRQMMFNQRRFARAARMSLRLLRRTDRTVFLHFVTLGEACLLAERTAKLPIRHFHAHFGTNSTEATMLVSLLTDTPYSFTVHGPDEFDRPEFIRLRDKVHHAKFAVAISSFGVGQMYRWVDFGDWRKIREVRCGLDETHHTVPYSVPAKPKQLVCVGRLAPQKGHVILIKALGCVIREGRDVELVLVGDGELRGEVEEAIRTEEGVGHSVRITGWASGEEVSRHIIESRALILTSFAEGLPVVIMEAMALGRPILSTNVAGVAELVLHERTGWLFTSGSVDAAAEAIRACLATTPSRLEEMGRCAQAKVKERHDQAREAAYLMRLIDDPADSLAERGPC